MVLFTLGRKQTAVFVRPRKNPDDFLPPDWPVAQHTVWEWKWSRSGQVRSGRVGSGWLGSGRVGSGQRWVHVTNVRSGRVRSGRVSVGFTSLTSGRVGSGQRRIQGCARLMSHVAADSNYSRSAR